MDNLLTLLTLQRQAQEAETFAEFLHIVANDSRKIIPYHQVTIYSYESGVIEFLKLSGNAVIDPNGEYAVHLKKCIDQRDKTRGEFSEHPTADEKSSLTIVPFYHKQSVTYGHEDEGELGGMCFETIFPYKDHEKQLIKELAQSYMPRMLINRLEKRSIVKKMLKNIRQKRIWILAAIMIAFCPTRLTISAPVEIVAKDPVMITAPFSGLVKEVLVKPGDTVPAFSPVARMEGTLLDADADLALEDIKLAEAVLSRLKRESLSNPQKRAELARMEAEIAEKKIRQAYAQSLKERANLVTPKAGVAIYADRNALEGKPVEAGQVLMQIANPQSIEARIRIPSSLMMPIKKNERADITLDPHPFHTYEGIIQSVGYEASVDPDGLLTYKVITQLTDIKDRAVRIGWRGTATIKGDWTVLGYRILRRPLIMLRQWTGL